MIERCTNQKSKAYKNYGGKGISVCNEWKIFVVFYDWAKNNGYDDKLTIDRINNSKNYCPKNCRWVDRFVQNSNTSKNRYIYFNGKNQTLSQWARELGIARNTLSERLKNHTIEESLSAIGSQRGRKI